MQQRSTDVTQVHEELVHLVRQLMTGERPADGLPTFAQHSVLSYIARNPGCRATEISDAFGVHRSTVSRQLRGCVDAGWVQAEPGPIRSGHPLSLTEPGRDLLDNADRRRLDEVGERVRDWSASDIADLARMLHRFRTSTADQDIAKSIGADPRA
ncbi:MarR family winged helix-turn-helix transcriptional regulator [Rhodococcus sp. NPDC058514]|uniref:MarR family winged helix-turn-helix transcriptional regulator n=1 Tax=unclassified Rhodococcus (in: high G+C Gram-positive bacteria) TaxID=192944 RepID=UPI0036582D7B